MSNEQLNSEDTTYDFSKYYEVRGTYEKKAEKIINRIVDEIKNDSVKYDRKSGMMLSGDDDLPKNVWEEYCYALQEGNSYFQDEYDEYFCAVIDNKLRKISTDEIELITIQTEEYDNWIDSGECEYNIEEYLNENKLPMISDFEECVMLIKQRLQNYAVNYELPENV